MTKQVDSAITRMRATLAKRSFAGLYAASKVVQTDIVNRGEDVMKRFSTLFESKIGTLDVFILTPCAALYDVLRPQLEQHKAQMKAGLRLSAKAETLPLDEKGRLQGFKDDEGCALNEFQTRGTIIMALVAALHRELAAAEQGMKPTSTKT